MKIVPFALEINYVYGDSITYSADRQSYHVYTFNILNNFMPSIKRK